MRAAACTSEPVHTTVALSFANLANAEDRDNVSSAARLGYRQESGGTHVSQRPCSRSRPHQDSSIAARRLQPAYRIATRLAALRPAAATRSEDPSRTRGPMGPDFSRALTYITPSFSPMQELLPGIDHRRRPLQEDVVSVTHPFWSGAWCMPRAVRVSPACARRQR